MYEIYQGISHPGCIPAYPGYGYMHRDLYETITSSHLTLQTKQGRIKNFKLSGVTRQVETTGAQLFDASKIPTTSSGGATVTNNGDGSFTVSGNGTLTSGFSHAIYLENEEVRRLFRPGEIYMAESPTATRPYFEVGFFKNDQNVCDIRPVSAFLKATLPDDFFAPENNLRVRYIFYGAPGSDIIPGTIKPMMYQDGDGTWEPYTGATSSPSPEYPQDIQGVGVRTKNLLDEKRMLDFILQKPGASIVQFDGRRCLKLDGAFSYPNFNLYEGFEPDKRYTLTYDGFYESYKGEANAGNGFVFRLQDGKHNYALAEASDIGIWKHKTVTTATGVEKIYITYGVISVVYIDLDTLQLEEGTTSTPFEPYGYRTDVVTRTEQLFGNVEYSSGTYDPLTGTLMQKDTSNTVQSQAKVSLRLNGTPVKHILVSNVLGYNSCTFIKDETFDSIRVSFNGNVKDTTADSTVKMIDGEQYTLSFNFISNELNAGVISNIMLNKGSTATPYQPYAYYTAPIYTREPLTQWDHIEYWNGEYGVVKKSAVVVEDGSRNVDDTHYPILFFSTLAKPMNVDAKVYCNYCSSERIGRLSILGKNICINSADTYWGFANAPECKAWLTQKNAEGKPLYYCYETAEESWEPLPASSQQALRNLPTYKGTTVIDTTDPLEPEITVSYRAAKKELL